MTPNTRLACLLPVLCLAIAGCGQLPRIGSGPDGGVRKIANGEAAEIQVALGRSLESEGDFDKAMAAYREAARRDPKRADAELRMAVLLDRLGRFSEASPHFEAALKASPGDAEIFCDRGYSFCLQGKNVEAEAALRQAIVRKPDLARAHNNLGLLLGRANRPDEALAEFRKAGCPEPDAHLNLAFALGQDRKWGEAKRHLQMAKTLGAHTPAVDEGAAELERLIARTEIARAIAPADPAVKTASKTSAGPSRP